MSPDFAIYPKWKSINFINLRHLVFFIFVRTSWPLLQKLPRMLAPSQFASGIVSQHYLRYCVMDLKFSDCLLKKGNSTFMLCVFSIDTPFTQHS